MKRAIGLLGGTFDPIHYGHLRPAQEAMTRLGLAEIRLLPNHIPPHRPQPVATSAQRLDMVRLAVEDLPGFSVDDRELRRSRPSWTIDTLMELRAELPDTPLCFLIGMDSLLSLPSWHRWEELLHYAHLVVSVRPGSAPEFPPAIQRLLEAHGTQRAADLHEKLAGCLLLLDNQPVDLSATELRAAMAQGNIPSDRLPEKVTAYIRRHGIYSGSMV